MNKEQEIKGEEMEMPSGEQLLEILDENEPIMPQLRVLAKFITSKEVEE